MPANKVRLVRALGHKVRRGNMQVVMIVAGLIALGLLVYLVVVLFRAEDV